LENDKLESWSEMIQNMIRGVGENLGPEEDWVPCLWSWGDAVELMAIADNGLKNDAAIAELGARMQENNTTAYALWYTGWGKTLSVEEQKYAEAENIDMAKVSAMPGRQEIVMLHIVDNEGHFIFLRANVTRHADKAPELGPFERFDEGVTEWSGRLDFRKYLK